MGEIISEDVLLKKSDFWLFSNFSEADFEIPDAYEEVAFEDEFMNVVAVSVVVSAALGIIANIGVLILSFSHVKGDFRHYVANLALVDIVCGVLFAFMGYINIDDMHKHFSISLMTYSALAFYGSFGVMIWALVPISISRVFALTRHKPYSKAMSARLPLVFCFLSDILPISILYIICIVDHDIARWLFYLYALLTAFAYVIAFTSNYMVFRIVSRHICVVQNLRDQARLIETRQVAVATLAQALVPLVCQVPAFLTLSSALLLTEPITNGNIISITQLWLASSPMLDAIITILVIKQYRKEAVQCVSSISNRFFHSKKKSTNTITICSEEREPFETRL